MAGLFGGAPFGFEQALAAKYAILAQQARAQETAANAAARLDDARALVVPRQADADIGKTNAEAALTRENTKYVGPLANASIFNTKAQGALFGQQALGESQLNEMGANPFATGAPRKRGPGMGSSLDTGDDFSAKIRSLLKEGLGY